MERGTFLISSEPMSWHLSPGFIPFWHHFKDAKAQRGRTPFRSLQMSLLALKSIIKGLREKTKRIEDNEKDDSTNNLALFISCGVQE